MFPFTYNGEDYNSCSNVDSGRLWCATTKDFDTDNKWGYCGSKQRSTRINIQYVKETLKREAKMFPPPVNGRYYFKSDIKQN